MPNMVPQMLLSFALPVFSGSGLCMPLALRSAMHSALYLRSHCLNSFSSARFSVKIEPRYDPKATMPMSCIEMYR